MRGELRKLQVDLDEIAETGEYSDPMMALNSYLDLETGEVVTISREEFRAVDDLYEEHGSCESKEPLDLAAIVAESDYPEWQRDAILLADQVNAEFGKRFVELPELESSTAYRDMEDFILTVEDQQLRQRLQNAVEGRGPFRRFKDVLYDERRTRDLWFVFSRERARERVRVWLEALGIEAIHTPRYPSEEDSSAPSPRQRLLEEVLLFTTAAHQLPGAVRIALIGSLTTNEPDPDDADLLVTVADDMDLAPLAKLGRQLSGHTQSFARGGEVFLADSQGNYLGRTCPWKQCEPFIRMSCQAQNCGRRQYLYDDLQNIRLHKEVITAPPVELWPQVVTRCPVPEDLQRVVLANL